MIPTDKPTCIGAICKAVSLSVLACALASCSGEDTEEIREPLVRPVKLLTPSLPSGLKTSRYPGTVEAAQFAELSFQVSGKIEEIPVKSAQHVNEGDLIASLDQRDFKSNLAAAQAAFRNADEQYQRANRLLESNAIAISTLEQRKKQLDSARSQFDVAQKALEDTVLRAPFSGYIARLPGRENQSVSAGTVIAKLTGKQRAEIVIDLPARVMADWQNMENTTARVILDAGDGTPIEAVFKSADLIADSVSQTYAVKFGFKSEEEYLILPGMAGTVELTSSRPVEPGQSKVSLPLSAILTDGSSKFVWVVDDDTMRVSKRAVNIVDGIGGSIIVTEGLGGDETIAIAGASFLAEGMEVRPWTD